MINEPLADVLMALPRFYKTEDVDLDNKIIHMHFFIGNCNWYVAEYDGENLFFGYVNLDDPINAEWGYFSLTELRELCVGVTLQLEAEGESTAFEIGHEIEWDQHWQPVRFIDLMVGGFL